MDGANQVIVKVADVKSGPGPGGAQEKRTVATPSAEYLALEKQRVPNRDLGAGIFRLREKAEVYLPRTSVETPFKGPDGREVDPWLARVSISHVENFLNSAVADAVGRVWYRDPKVLDGTPEKIKKLYLDVDGRGTSLQVFGASASVRACQEGSDFVFVDYPKTNADGKIVTSRDAENAGLRPVWRRYSPSCVIGWGFGVRNNVPRLELVRLLETYSEPGSSEWDPKTGIQVRVLRAGKWDAEKSDPARFATSEIWRNGDDDEWKPVSKSLARLEPQIDIPFLEWPTDVARPFECPPPYSDVTVLTLAIFRKQNLLDSAQATVGFPILHWAGAPFGEDGRPLPLSPDRFYRSKDPNAKMEYVEVAGSSWEQIRKTIEEMKSSIARMTAEVLLASSPGTLTATGEAVRSARAATRLGTWRSCWQDAVARATYFSAVYLDLVDPTATAGWGGVELNNELFPKSKPENVLDHRKWLKELKVLSDQGAFEEAQNDEVISRSRDFEAEKKRVEEEEKQAPEGLPTREPGDFDPDADEPPKVPPGTPPPPPPEPPVPPPPASE